MSENTKDNFLHVNENKESIGQPKDGQAELGYIVQSNDNVQVQYEQAAQNDTNQIKFDDVLAAATALTNMRNKRLAMSTGYSYSHLQSAAPILESADTVSGNSYLPTEDIQMDPSTISNDLQSNNITPSITEVTIIPNIPITSDKGHPSALAPMEVGITCKDNSAEPPTTSLLYSLNAQHAHARDSVANPIENTAFISENAQIVKQHYDYNEPNVQTNFNPNVTITTTATTTETNNNSQESTIALEQTLIKKKHTPPFLNPVSIYNLPWCPRPLTRINYESEWDQQLTKYIMVAPVKVKCVPYNPATITLNTRGTTRKRSFDKLAADTSINQQRQHAPLMSSITDPQQYPANLPRSPLSPSAANDPRFTESNANYNNNIYISTPGSSTKNNKNKNNNANVTVTLEIPLHQAIQTNPMQHQVKIQQQQQQHHQTQQQHLRQSRQWQQQLQQQPVMVPRMNLGPAQTMEQMSPLYESQIQRQQQQQQQHPAQLMEQMSPLYESQIQRQQQQQQQHPAQLMEQMSPLYESQIQRQQQQQQQHPAQLMPLQPSQVAQQQQSQRISPIFTVQTPTTVAQLREQAVTNQSTNQSHSSHSYYEPFPQQQ